MRRNEGGLPIQYGNALLLKFSVRLFKRAAAQTLDYLLDI